MLLSPVWSAPAKRQMTRCQTTGALSRSGPPFWAVALHGPGSVLARPGPGPYKIPDLFLWMSQKSTEFEINQFGNAETNLNTSAAEYVCLSVS